MVAAYRKTHFPGFRDNLSFRFQATAAGSTGLKCLVHSLGLRVLKTKTTEERSTHCYDVMELALSLFYHLDICKIGKASIG
jgi:predicted porin